jgi:hypothetical protein
MRPTSSRPRVIAVTAFAATALVSAPQAKTPRDAPVVVHIENEGFRWGDAGIGAAAGFGAGLVLAGGLALTGRPRRDTRPPTSYRRTR